MSFHEIEAKARRAGFPPPIRSGDTAVIVIPCTEATDSPALKPARPSMDKAAFAEWAQSVGGWQAAANWLNDKLHTRYTRADVWRWAQPGSADRPVPSKVAKLLEIAEKC